MNDEGDAGFDRRTVLKSVGAGTVFGVGAVPTASGADDGSTVGIEVDPATYRPDTDDVPGVTDAVIRINEDGSVSKELDFEVDVSPDRTVDAEPGADDGPTATVFSLNLEVAAGELRPEEDGIQPRTDAFSADLERREATVQPGVQSTGFGLPDEPSPGARDFGSFVHTQSQECGPLARTNSLADALSDYLYNQEFDREMVEGDACEGEEWNSTFSVFCDYAEHVPGLGCSVPSVFNTTWNDVVRLRDAGYDEMAAGTVFTCGNFPVIPETVVSAHELETSIDGTTITASWGVTHGIVPWNDVGDYDLDWNGLANVIVDGLSAAYPTEAYSYVMAQFFLKDDGGIVT